MQYGIGVLGATGYIGTPYRKEIREAHDAEVKIVALCARRLNLLEDAGAEDGASLLTDQWEQVVEHPEVNLVLVLTPDALHENPVLAAAEAGKHVVLREARRTEFGPGLPNVEGRAIRWRSFLCSVLDSLRWRICSCSRDREIRSAGRYPSCHVPLAQSAPVVDAIHLAR